MTGKFGEKTNLSDLNLPHLEVILEEAFGLPPSAIFPDFDRPQTIADLARVTGISHKIVIRRLKEVQHLATDIEIDCKDLAALMGSSSPPILIDVREGWEYEICHLPGSILLASASFPDLLPMLVQAARVVAICHHGIRSLSAALYLRKQGVTGAQSLSGGVGHWAKSIDLSMARY